MNTDILSFVLHELEKNKGNHRQIAQASGVPYSTLTKISQGVTPNPGIQSIQALANFFLASKSEK